MAGVEPQGGRLRGGPAAFPEQGPRKSRLQAGFAGGAGPHGSSGNYSFPCLLSPKRASDSRGHACGQEQQTSQSGPDGWMTEEPSFLLQRKVCAGGGRVILMTCERLLCEDQCGLEETPIVIDVHLPLSPNCGSIIPKGSSWHLNEDLR